MPLALGQAAFVPTFCRLRGPRQGKDVRQCVVTRQRLPRSLLWRVVRVRRPDGGYSFTVGRGEGRSVYVSKSLQVVKESLRKKRLNKSLRSPIPTDVQKELETLAASWDLLSSEEKGMMYCEVYGQEGVAAAVDEVQMTTLRLAEDFLHD